MPFLAVCALVVKSDPFPLPSLTYIHTYIQALGILSKMEAAVSTYRKTAKIDGADGGIGEFPTDNKLGASFSNNNPTLYNKKK